MSNKNVLILGAGVSGLTTALKLLQAGHKVTIWSKEAAGEFPNTSFNAYAMWVPVKIDADARVERWANESYTAFEALSQNTATGVVMRNIVNLKNAHEEPWYAGKQTIFRHAAAAEITSEYADAHVLDKAPAIDPTVYLPWLHAQVVAAGGTFQQNTVQQFSDCPAQFDVVVNCTGLGSRTLAGDKGLFPERVQVVKVKAGGVDTVVMDDEGPNKRACIVPHGGYIKLGAVFDGASESLEVDDKHTQDILERCSRLIPGVTFQKSDIISVTRALRPERAGWLARVEVEKLEGGQTVVHNYGHDGMGYILSYGIAAEIVGYVAAL